MENIKDRINQIKKDIKSLNLELEKIQSECKHEKTTIKFVTDCNSVRKVCDICDLVIGFATEKELKDNNFLS